MKRHKTCGGQSGLFNGGLIFFGLLITIVILSSCTTRIVSRPLNDKDPATGLVYHLPATDISYVMTFRLTDCRGAIEIRDTAIELKAVPDRGAGTYLIDTSSLSGLSKTVPLARFTIDNGILTSISYEAKDNTGDIVKSGVSLVKDVAASVLPGNLSLLSLASTLLVSSRSLGQTHMVRSFQFDKSRESDAADGGFCNQLTKNSLDEYDFLLKHLGSMKKKLYEAEVQLAEKRDGMTEKIQDIENVIKKTKERLTELDKYLTIQYRHPLIIEAGKCDSFGDITLDSAPFTKWFKTGGDNESFRNQFQTWLEENKLSYTISNCTLAAKDQQPTGGDALYYRIPARCKLEITKDTLVSASHIEVMQCGRLAGVEITNGAFQNNSHRIEFDPLTGEIKTFELKDNTVRATEALDKVSEAVKKPAK